MKEKKRGGGKILFGISIKLPDREIILDLLMQFPWKLARYTVE